VKFKTIQAVVFAALFLSSCQSTERYAEEKYFDPNSPWRLTFSDDFEGQGKPNPSKWQSEQYNRRDNPNGPDGWWDAEQVRLDGEGNLILLVAQIPNRNHDADPYDFATGMVTTKGLFEQKYGRFEMRGRLPRQSGWGGAFWLFSKGAADIGDQGRDGSEIDIMEGFGRSDDIRHAIHWDGKSIPSPIAEEVIEWPDVQDGFHTYALEWSPTEYVFFIDGIETWRTDAGGVSQVPAYIKLTGEISTQGWALTDQWAGAIEPMRFPDAFIIDYVKVWSK